MKDKKLMSICEQFIILKYAFHGAVDQIFKDFARDEFKDKMVKYTKATLLKAGQDMLEHKKKSEAIELFNQLKDGE